MAEQIVIGRIQMRRRVAVLWSALNEILKEGEIGVVIDTNPIKFKIGDGFTPWNDLPFAQGEIPQGQYAGRATPSMNPGTQTTPVYYTANQAGTYTNFGGVILPANSQGYINWTGSVWTIDYFTMTLDNYLQKTGINTRPGGKNEANTARVVQGSINSLGNLGSTTNVNRKSIVGQPVISGQHYKLSGMAFASGKSIAFKNASNVLVGTVITGSAIPASLTAPTGAVTVDYTVRLDEANDAGWVNLQWEKGDVATSYEAYIPLAYSIDGKSFSAKALEAGNSVTDPVDSFNATNKGWVEVNTLLISAIKSRAISLNLFNPKRLDYNGDWSEGGFLYDYAISNITGNLTPSPGWITAITRMTKFPIPTPYAFGGINLGGTGNSSFYKRSPSEGLPNTDHKYNGTFNSGDTKTYTSDADSKYLGVTIRRPLDADSVWQGTARVNEGSVLQPYDVFKQEAYEMAGRSLASSGGGGQTFDQDLNKADSPEFVDLSVSSLQTGALIALLPEGAGTPPVGVVIGDAWIDTTNDSIKVRRV